MAGTFAEGSSLRPITRTAAEGVPFVPAVLNLAGDYGVNGAPVTSPPLLYAGVNVTGQPTYTNTGHPTSAAYFLYHTSNNEWILDIPTTGGVWMAVSPNVWEIIRGDVTLNPLSGTDTYGTPSVEGSGSSSLAAPAFPGQRCVVGTTNPLEFTSLDGTTWALTGPAGVFEDTANPGTYYRTSVANGILQTEIYTPAD
jgi:hypothetical protein